MNINARLSNEHQTPDYVPERIAELLTCAAEQLDSDTVEALRQSRQTALKRQSVRARSASLTSGYGIYWPIFHSARQWMAILLMAVVVAGAGYWQHHNKHETMTNLDIAILTDDMPLEVFIDP